MEITSYLLGKKAGGTQPTGEISITENGKTNVSGYATADVNVQPTLQNKSVPITTNGSTSVSADENYDGLDTVTITTNVQPDLETKSITITENTTTTITPTSGKDGLSSVEVITNVSGGGGGPDWSTIGYSQQPSCIQDFYDIAKDIYDNWDSSVTSMYQMYRNNKDITVFPLVDTSNVTNTQFAFASSNILQMPLLDTSNVTNAESMLGGVRITELPPFNLSKATNLKNAFNGTLIKEVPQLTMPNVNTNCETMFAYCYNLESVSQLDTSKAITVKEMFNYCNNLKNVPVFDWSNITTTFNALYQVFGRCTSLTDQSLDNILQSCISAVNFNPSIASRKSLRENGLCLNDTTIYPDSRIQALPHYQDFIDAGWTIS